MSMDRALASAPNAASGLADVDDGKPEVAQHLSRERRDFTVVFDKQHLTTVRAVASNGGRA